MTKKDCNTASKAGTQKSIAGKAGCPLGAGMTVKLPDRSFIIWKVGTIKGCVNIRTEEIQIDDHD